MVFFLYISLLKIIIVELITKAAPNKVFIVGTSSHIKYPNTIANNKVKYFKGVTSETSEYLYDWLNHKLATPPKIPIKDNKIKWFKLGIIQPWGIVKKLKIVIERWKNKMVKSINKIIGG